MAISDDQKAVLELLLGGQTYEDLDDLFALEDGDTRKRARAALEDIGGADPDRNVGLTDYLLGQADPIGRADASRHLRQDPADAELAQRISTELSTLFPAASLPKLPTSAPGSSGRFMSRSAPASAPPASAQPAGEPKPPRKSSFTPQQTRLFAGLGAAAVVLVVVVLAVAGVFSGGDDDPAPTADSPASSEGEDPSSPLASGGQEITRVALAPVSGGDAAGAAIVGIATGDQPYLDLVIKNLQEAPQDRAYIAWFMFDETRGYPLPEPIIPQRGSYENRIAIPKAVAEPISRAIAIEVSLSDPNEIEQAIRDAVDENTFAITVPGEAVLLGQVPRQPTGSGDQQAPGEGQAEDPEEAPAP